MRDGINQKTAILKSKEVFRNYLTYRYLYVIIVLEKIKEALTMTDYQREQIYKIKKEGKLIAICGFWQYWLQGNIIYSIGADGISYSIWCGVDRLNRHLHRLYQITGRKYFTEHTDTLILDKDFISQFAYA